jgi:hypothetical protein
VFYYLRASAVPKTRRMLTLQRGSRCTKYRHMQSADLAVAHSIRRGLQPLKMHFRTHNRRTIRTHTIATSALPTKTSRVPFNCLRCRFTSSQEAHFTFVGVEHDFQKPQGYTDIISSRHPQKLFPLIVTHGYCLRRSSAARACWKESPRAAYAFCGGRALVSFLAPWRELSEV